MTNVVISWSGVEHRDEEIENQYRTRGCATLSKTSGITASMSPCSSFNCQTSTFSSRSNYNTLENKGKKRSSSLGFQETFKTTASVFGTFLHSKKNKRKSGDSISCFTPMNNNESEGANYVDGKLMGVSKEEIVRLLTPSKSYYPDLQSMFTISLCCRLYTHPLEILEQVHKAVMIELSLSKEDHRLVLKRLAQLIDQWSNTFPCDFKEKSDRERLLRIFNFITTVQPDLKKDVALITKNLNIYLEDRLVFINRCTQEAIEYDEIYLLMDLCNNEPVVIAEQLTIIELERFSKVTLEELVRNFALSKIKKSAKKQTEKFADAGKSMVEIYADWFNRLSHLVATEICMCPKLEERAKIINFFVEVGKQCFKLSNFNSLMAILTGLNMSSVNRMRRTWSHSNRSGFLKLERELSPNNNFARYRETLALRKSLKDSTKYIIPLFALVLKDLTFINEGFETMLPNGLVNFEKFTNFAKEIRSILELQSKHCKFQKVSKIADYLLRSPLCNEEGLYKSSFEVEPPDSSFERDRYRSVKMKVKST